MTVVTDFCRVFVCLSAFFSLLPNIHAMGDKDRKFIDGRLEINDYNLTIDLENGWDFERLQKLASRHASLESLLVALLGTGEFEEAFHNPTFVFESLAENAEHVNPQNPRVLLAKDKLLLAFDASQSGLQIIEALPEEGKFAAHEIVYGGKKAKVFSHPQSCQNCHGPSMKPLWSSYPFSVGVYGMSESNVEKAYREFIAGGARGPMYRKFFNSAFQKPGSHTSVKIGPLRFSVHLTLFLSQMAKHDLSVHPDREQYRYPILAALQGCDVTDFFPEDVKVSKPELFNRTLDNISLDLQMLLKSELDERIQRHSDVMGEPIGSFTDFDSQNVKTYARLKYVLEPMNIFLESWGFQSAPGSLEAPTFANGSGGFFDFKKWGLDALLSGSQTSRISSPIFSCEELHERSQAQFRKN